MPNSDKGPFLTPAEFRARAIAMVGLPYILGAEWSPSVVAPKRPKALDCSELIEGLCRENGTPIGDLAAAQYDRTVKATGSPRVGDLVFLRNNRSRWNGIGHVAVITGRLANGDWEIVEARGRKYGVVRSTLSYWKTRGAYTGLRRFPAFALRPERKPHPPVPGAPAFPLTRGFYFGPKSGPDRSVSGYYGRKFAGRTDNYWLAKWQQQAKKIGAYTGKVDGEWGPLSRKAALRIQKRAGVHQSGLAGRGTWDQAWKLEGKM